MVTNKDVGGVGKAVMDLTQPEVFNLGARSGAAQSTVTTNTSVPVAGTENLSSTGRSSISVLQDYAVRMQPKKSISEAEAIQLQVGLYNAVLNTINRNDIDFSSTFAQLLKVIEDNKSGAFHESRIFRYAAQSTMGVRFVEFSRIMLFLIHIAPVNGRAIVMKQFSFDKVFQSGITEAGRQKLLAFFDNVMPH